MKFTCLKVEENGDLTFTVRGPDLQAGTKIVFLAEDQYEKLVRDHNWAKGLRDTIEDHLDNTMD